MTMAEMRLMISHVIESFEGRTDLTKREKANMVSALKAVLDASYGNV